MEYRYLLPYTQDYRDWQKYYFSQANENITRNNTKDTNQVSFGEVKTQLVSPIDQLNKQNMEEEKLRKEEHPNPNVPIKVKNELQKTIKRKAVKKGGRKKNLKKTSKKKKKPVKKRPVKRSKKKKNG